MYATAEQEMVARLRRIETRLSVFMEAQGVSLQSRRAERRGSVVHTPSPGVSIHEILSLMDVGETVAVVSDGVNVCHVRKS